MCPPLRGGLFLLKSDFFFLLSRVVYLTSFVGLSQLILMRVVPSLDFLYSSQLSHNDALENSAPKPQDSWPYQNSPE